MLAMICMRQFAVLMELLMVMIATLKMQVSPNGLKVSVNEKQNYNQPPHSWGFLFVGGWVDLDMIRYISVIFFIGLIYWSCEEEKTINPLIGTWVTLDVFDVLGRHIME